MTSQKTCRYENGVLINLSEEKKMKCIFISLLLLCSSLFVCCHSQSPKQSAATETFPPEISVRQADIRYAEGFKLDYRQGYILLRIQDPQSPNSSESVNTAKMR